MNAIIAQYIPVIMIVVRISFDETFVEKRLCDEIASSTNFFYKFYPSPQQRFRVIC